MPAPPFPQPLRGVLFDLDGTLVDSEPLHYASTNRILAAFGHRLEYTDFKPFIGSSDEPFWSALQARFGIPGRPRELAAQRTAAFLDLLAEVRMEPLPGVLSLLRRLHAAGVAAAVVSSSPRDAIDGMLAAAGLSALLPLRVSGHDDCARSKPFPDCYLAAAARLRAAPASCIAVEDSCSGVAAALAAGVFTVAVPSRTHPDPDLRAAHLRLCSLEELLERLDGLPR